jgi:hypothetical protein
MLERYGAYAILAGALILVFSWLWLLVRGFRVRFWWGLGLLLFPPLVLLFLLRHGRKAVGPMVGLLLGAAIVAVPFGVSYYQEQFVDLGPRERVVEEELHITLTGWDGTDYAVLRAKPQTVVLQMANEDVTDQTLEYIRGMSQLRELDLNDTKITDEGLRILSELPRLESLRLRGTPITEDGFRQYLMPKESLKELDLRQTDCRGVEDRARMEGGTARTQGAALSPLHSRLPLG